jgi:hypothetical protein
MHWSKSEVRRLTSLNPLQPHVLKNVSGSFHERLDTLSHTLGALAASLAALHPAFATFYDFLNDEQKARLVAKSRIRRRPAPVGREISLASPPVR